MTITIPEVEIPHFVFGDNKEGLGRGKGKEGDTVGRDPQPGQGQGAGDQPGEGITIQVDLDDVLKFLEEELKLPRMKPKPNETFEEIRIKYNDISRTGPESLRHTRRTMVEALKRLALMGGLDDLHMVPGSRVPVRLITPINSDRRYRQYKEIRIPSSNAVIFFARDCSGSMDDYRCDIVSDMAWWIDCWIRRYYTRVDRCYFVHDTQAQEVNEETFYKYRYGGGTMCSSAFEAITAQLENRYPPANFNVYIFYFTDGDNWGDDTKKVIKIIQDKLGPQIVNMIGVAQICPWGTETVKKEVDEALKKGELSSELVRTAEVAPKDRGDAPMGGMSNWGYHPNLSEDERNEQIIDSIRKLLAEKQAGAA